MSYPTKTDNNSKLNLNNMKLTIETAQEMYKSDIPSIKQFALDNYPELDKPKLPKTWKELKEISGYYVLSDSRIHKTMYRTTEDCEKNVFPTEKHAKASIALAQLLQLRNKYRESEEKDIDFTKIKYNHCIYLNGNVWKFLVFTTYNQIFSFTTEKIRDEFYNNFKDLLEEVKPLFSGE